MTAASLEGCYFFLVPFFASFKALFVPPKAAKILANALPAFKLGFPMSISFQFAHLGGYRRSARAPTSVSGASGLNELGSLGQNDGVGRLA